MGNARVARIVSGHRPYTYFATAVPSWRIFLAEGVATSFCSRQKTCKEIAKQNLWHLLLERRRQTFVFATLAHRPYKSTNLLNSHPEMWSKQTTSENSRANADDRKNVIKIARAVCLPKGIYINFRLLRAQRFFFSKTNLPHGGKKREL